MQDRDEVLEVCQVCRVSITKEGQVNFSYGEPGTRARLFERVCQHTQKPGCINKDFQGANNIPERDRYPEEFGRA